MDTSHVASGSPKFQTLRQCKRKDSSKGLEGGNQHSQLVVRTVTTEMIDSVASRSCLFKPRFNANTAAREAAELATCSKSHDFSPT